MGAWLLWSSTSSALGYSGASFAATSTPLWLSAPFGSQSRCLLALPRFSSWHLWRSVLSGARPLQRSAVALALGSLAAAQRSPVMHHTSARSTRRCTAPALGYLAVLVPGYFSRSRTHPRRCSAEPDLTTCALPRSTVQCFPALMSNFCAWSFGVLGAGSRWHSATSAIGRPSAQPP